MLFVLIWSNSNLIIKLKALRPAVILSHVFVTHDGASGALCAIDFYFCLAFFLSWSHIELVLDIDLSLLLAFCDSSLNLAVLDRCIHRHAFTHSWVLNRSPNVIDLTVDDCSFKRHALAQHRILDWFSDVMDLLIRRLLPGWCRLIAWLLWQSGVDNCSLLRRSLLSWVSLLIEFSSSSMALHTHYYHDDQTKRQQHIEWDPNPLADCRWECLNWSFSTLC